MCRYMYWCKIGAIWENDPVEKYMVIVSVQNRCNFKKEIAQVVEIQQLARFKSVQDEIRTHTALRPLPPQSSVSTNSTTWTVERQTGLGPATSTLARSRSTN